jgi:hypothetical protein
MVGGAGRNRLQPGCDSGAMCGAETAFMTTTASTHLTNGWDAALPVGDSLLRRYLFCWAALCEAFARAAGGRSITTPRFAAADYRRPSGWFNSATLLQPTSDESFDDVVDDVESFFAGGHGEVHLWSSSPTPDLSPRGWELVGHPPFLVRPPAALVPPPAAPALDVADVTHPAALTEWEQVAAEGYPLPELLPVVPGALADPSLLEDPRLRLSLGREDGKAVSLGALFCDYGVGCFGLGVTRREWRGHGHWKAHAVRRLAAAPDLWMTGVFSDDSRPPAERLGFVAVLRLTLWVRRRPA